MRPGPAKITFGTGGMLDMVLGPKRPRFETRGEGGTFPIVTWRLDGVDTWGLEAIMLSAGTNVEWLRDDLGILASSDESHEVAQQCADTGGVVFVPALLGLGTPPGTTAHAARCSASPAAAAEPQIVRAVLEGVAHTRRRPRRGGRARLRPHDRRAAHRRRDVANPTFVQALADAAQKPVEVSPVKEATTLGAGFLAGLAVGTWPDLDALAATWKPVDRVEPERQLDRDRWQDASTAPPAGSPTSPPSTSSSLSLSGPRHPARLLRSRSL